MAKSWIQDSEVEKKNDLTTKLKVIYLPVNPELKKHFHVSGIPLLVVFDEVSGQFCFD